MVYPNPFIAWYGVPPSAGGGGYLWKDVSQKVWESVEGFCYCPVNDAIFYGASPPDWTSLGMTPVFICYWTISGAGAAYLRMFYLTDIYLLF